MVQLSQPVALRAGLPPLHRPQAIADKVPVWTLRERLQLGHAHRAPAVEPARSLRAQPGRTHAGDERVAHIPRAAGIRLLRAQHRVRLAPRAGQLRLARIRQAAQAHGQRVQRRARAGQGRMLALVQRAARHRQVRKHAPQRQHRRRGPQRASLLIRQRIADQQPLRGLRHRLQHVQARQLRAVRIRHAQVRLRRTGRARPFLVGEQAPVGALQAAVVHAQHEQRVHARGAHVAHAARDQLIPRRGQRGQLHRAHARLEHVQHGAHAAAVPAQQRVHLVQQLHEQVPHLRAVRRLDVQPRRDQRLLFPLQRVKRAARLQVAKDRIHRPARVPRPRKGRLQLRQRLDDAQAQRLGLRQLLLAAERERQPHAPRAHAVGRRIFV